MKLLSRDLERYSKNGFFGTLIGISITLLFFFGWIEFMRQIWPAYMQIQKDYNLHPVLHVSFYMNLQGQCLLWGSSFVLYLIYRGKYAIFEKDRAKGSEDEQWPWESMEPDQWKKHFRRSIYLNLINSLVSTNFIPLILYFIPDFPDYYPTGIDQMPSPIVFAAQIVFCSMFEDFMFYFTHRSLHQSWIYPSIHKIHHENKVTYCLAAIHTHPLEYIVGNMLPMMIGPALLNVRMHRAALFGWYALRSFESIDAHSGYSFSWSPFRLLPCQPEGDYHFFHHESNVGNYSTFFTWWDTIFGTNTVFYKHQNSKKTQ